MAALPLEAFTEEDPPVEDPAFYYPPGKLTYFEICNSHSPTTKYGFISSCVQSQWLFCDAELN